MVELIPGMASMVMATLWTGLLLLAGYLVIGLVSQRTQTPSLYTELDVYRT